MGTSTFSKNTGRCLQDHPHAYGDKLIPLLQSIIKLGSSPRVWGQDLRSCNTAVFDGIIPTRMGTRSLFHSSPFSIRDHPHAYGDKLNFSPRLLIGIGSSPRVWGQVWHKQRAVYQRGIIPTRMGTRISARYVCG